MSINLPLFIHAGCPPHTFTLIQYHSLPRSPHCAVVVKVIAWLTALEGDACSPCVLWRQYCEEGIKHLSPSLAGQHTQSAVRCKWMTWRKSKCSHSVISSGDRFVGFFNYTVFFLFPWLVAGVQLKSCSEVVNLKILFNDFNTLFFIFFIIKTNYYYHLKTFTIHSWTMKPRFWTVGRCYCSSRFVLYHDKNLKLNSKYIS